MDLKRELKVTPKLSENATALLETYVRLCEGLERGLEMLDPEYAPVSPPSRRALNLYSVIQEAGLGYIEGREAANELQAAGTIEIKGDLG